MEGLTSRCVRLSTKAKGAERDAAWDWLSENNITAAANVEETSSVYNTAATTTTAPVPRNSTTAAGSSSVDSAWKLLEILIQRLEKKGGQSVIHKAVANRLFSQGVALPAWLVATYKKVTDRVGYLSPLKQTNTNL